LDEKSEIQILKSEMKIIVYEKPTWTTCRNLAQLFRENNIEYDRVNYFTEPLSEEKLRDLLKKAGLKPFEVLRKGEAAFKELNLSKETPDDEVIRAIVENPGLLQRPIVEVGRRAVLARPIENALDLINSAR
jgi:arsenate reductase